MEVMGLGRTIEARAEGAIKLMGKYSTGDMMWTGAIIKVGELLLLLLLFLQKTPSRRSYPAIWLGMGECCRGRSELLLLLLLLLLLHQLLLPQTLQLALLL